ncbi:glycosyltransferase family 4 protein [Agrilactobacillus yilanensis]|nr:glycosyltransferase family 4 protein [Agrilactobacillus yilanensis]
MRILHVQAQLPAKTGSGVYFANVIKGLKTYDQACLYGSFGDFEFDLLPKDRQYAVKFPNETCEFPLPGMSDVMPYESTVYGEMTPAMIADWQFVFRQKLRQAVNQFKPDIIFCHHLWLLTALVRQEYPNLPIYAFCHGTDLRQAHQHPDLLARYVLDLNGLTRVFALSHDQVPAIQETYHISKARITVLGGGFDPEIFYPKEKFKKESIDIIYAGKIAEAKGIYALAEAFGQISDQFPEAQLHLIGNPAPEAHQRLTPYFKNSQIKLYNVVDQPSLATIFRQADIFTLPSYYEGLGLVNIEALACGLRVVTTEIPALKEQLGSVVNDSGVISYVSLPGLVDQDKPVKADLPAFYQRLAQALAAQIEACRQQVPFSDTVQQAVLESSWPQLIQRIEQKIIQ